MPIVGDRTPRETDNREHNKSVVGVHVDNQSIARLTRWGAMLAEHGIRDEYAFLAARDSDLRELFGGSDEPIVMIRRAIKHDDNALLKHVWPTPVMPIRVPSGVVSERLVPRIPPVSLPGRDPSATATLERVTVVAPTPTPAGPQDRASNLTIPPPMRAITPTRIEDAVAAARLLVEADDEEAKLKKEIAFLEKQIRVVRDTIDSVGEQKRRALEMLLSGSK